VLVFPSITDRLIVLGTGLVLCGVLAWLVNRLRLRSDRERDQ